MATKFCLPDLGSARNGRLLQPAKLIAVVHWRVYCLHHKCYFLVSRLGKEALRVSDYNVEKRRWRLKSNEDFALPSAAEIILARNRATYAPWRHFYPPPPKQNPRAFTVVAVLASTTALEMSFSFVSYVPQISAAASAMLSSLSAVDTQDSYRRVKAPRFVNFLLNPCQFLNHVEHCHISKQLLQFTATHFIIRG